MRKMKQFFILINLLLCCITEIKSSLENCGKLKSNFLFPHPDPSNMMKRAAALCCQMEMLIFPIPCLQAVIVCYLKISLFASNGSGICKIWSASPGHFKWHTEAYDIGIVKFSTPVLFNHSIQPICLPSFHNYQPDFRECYTAGWRGVGGNSNLYWKFLSQMRLKVIECKHKHRLTSFSVLKPICADGLINGQEILAVLCSA
ncbi:Clotting factor G beta subunit [Trichinella pseudospiralis]